MAALWGLTPSLWLYVNSWSPGSLSTLGLLRRNLLTDIQAEARTRVCPCTLKAETRAGVLAMLPREALWQLTLESLLSAEETTRTQKRAGQHLKGLAKCV